MLDPNSRQTYMEQLRPPTGYSLDRALATTFSLDLMTLLMAPLSMALSECKKSKEEAMQDPMAVLEAIRQTTDRIAIFCQQGRIAVPAKDTLLYRYLEPIVVEVQPPHKEGVFHPKTWLIRFVSEDNSEPVIYRFLCLSRNLTFDRSWDTVLTLQGPLIDRERAFSRNRPLADFVAALPGLAVRSPSDKARKLVSEMAREVQKVRFEPPEEFADDIKFIPLGLPGYGKPLKINDYSRLLIMSPFLSADIVRELAEQGHANVLVSREESLDALDDKTVAQIEANAKLFYLDSGAEQPEESTEVRPDEQVPGVSTNDLSGLHAKLYIVEDGKYVRLLSGSANATSAGLDGRNVEFLVQMGSTRKYAGIDEFLGSDDSRLSFRSMLRPYSRQGGEAKTDTTAKELEEALETARRTVSAMGLSAVVTPGQAGAFDLAIKGASPVNRPAPMVSGRCYPISLQVAAAIDVAPLLKGEDLVFRDVSAVALTGFVAFILSARQKTKEASIAFVLNLPVDGMPADRDRRILQEIVGDPGRFIRYLMFILAEEDDLVELALRPVTDGNGGTDAGWGEAIPLLEELVRAYSRHPEKIDRISRLVEDIKQAEGAGRRILPLGFEGIWNVFLLARGEGTQT